uniref:Uncharacterized protein n=1 Tax=Anopheles dirus TaxID=7168 RepID=A0A182MY11_9DIPT
MPIPILAPSMATVAGSLPPVSTSDSRNVMPPGMLMSNRWILRYVATSEPSGDHTVQVLYSLLSAAHRSGIVPPIRVTSASAYGAAAALVGCYLTDWKVIVAYIPFYGSKFDKKD